MNTKHALILTVAALMGASMSTHAEFCAVQLSVTYPDNQPIVLGRAELLDSTGRIISAGDVRSGHGEFCDFGFGEHSIRVSSDLTLPVVIHGVRLHYGNTQTLRVVLNQNPDHKGDVAPSSGNACSAYARITSVDGKSLSGVKVTYAGFTSVSDSFGRVVFLIPLNKFASFRFAKAGMQDRELTLSCSEPSERFERVVILLPATAR